MVNFKNFDVINLERNNCNTHFAIIPKSKGSQTIKFNQLIVHSKRNMFFLLKNHKKIVMLEQLVVHFWEHENWAYVWIISLSLCTVCFHFMLNSRAIEIVTDHLICLIYSFFKKQKEVWNYSPCLFFQMIFEESISHSLFYLVNKFNCLVAFTFLRSWTICLLYLFIY